MNLIALLLSLSLINALPTDSMIDKRGLNLNVFSKLKPGVKRPAPIHKADKTKTTVAKLNLHNAASDTISVEARKMIQSWEFAQRDYYDALRDLARKKKIYNSDGTLLERKQLISAEIRVSYLGKILDSLNPKAQADILAKRLHDIRVDADNIYKEAERKLRLLDGKEYIPKYAAIVKEMERKLSISRKLILKADSIATKLNIAREAKRLNDINREKLLAMI